MSSHQEMQKRLKTAIQNAILEEGTIEGTNDVFLTNTDVVEALLEITGFYSSLHGFENYEPIDIAFKNAMILNEHIYRFLKIRRQGDLPMDFIPRSKVN